MTVSRQLGTHPGALIVHYCPDCGRMFDTPAVATAHQTETDPPLCLMPATLGLVEVRRLRVWGLPSIHDGDPEDYE